MITRYSGLPHHTRNSMGTSGNVFEDLRVSRRDISIVLQDPKEFDIISLRIEAR